MTRNQWQSLSNQSQIFSEKHQRNWKKEIGAKKNNEKLDQGKEMNHMRLETKALKSVPKDRKLDGLRPT